MSEDDELTLLIEHRQNTRDYLEAKAAYQADPGNEELRAAKLAAGETLRTHRAHWRKVRSYLRETGQLAAAPGDATAAPETVGAKVEGRI